jgi:hypothetical protein
MLTYNANLSKEGKPVDVSVFLPYPQLDEEKEKTKMKINTSTLDYLVKKKLQLPIFVRVAMDGII